jgi:hypothetical protein
MSFFKRGVMRLAAVLAAVGLSVGAAAACPNYNMSTVFGQGTLNAGFMPDPIQIPRITAGGTQNLANCFPGQGLTGWVVSRPDYRLFYNGTSPTGFLTFILNSNATDPLLLINAPDGSWHFDDDSGGNLNARYTFTNPLSGQYDIWTGAYQRSSNNRAQLLISEFQ